MWAFWHTLVCNSGWRCMFVFFRTTHLFVLHQSICINPCWSRLFSLFSVIAHFYLVSAESTLSREIMICISLFFFFLSYMSLLLNNIYKFCVLVIRYVTFSSAALQLAKYLEISVVLSLVPLWIIVFLWCCVYLASLCFKTGNYECCLFSFVYLFIK